MSVSVSMPQLGESVTEGTVTRWLKKEGERVEADEPLLEVPGNRAAAEPPPRVRGPPRGTGAAGEERGAGGADRGVSGEPAGGGGGAGAPPAEAAPGQAPPAEAAQQQPQAAGGQE